MSIVLFIRCSNPGFQYVETQVVQIMAIGCSCSFFSNWCLPHPPCTHNLVEIVSQFYISAQCRYIHISDCASVKIQVMDACASLQVRDGMYPTFNETETRVTGQKWGSNYARGLHTMGALVSQVVFPNFPGISPNHTPFVWIPSCGITKIQLV